MSTSPRIGDITDSSGNQNETLTSFWGLGCLCGNQYSQVVQRRFRITRAVLDPSSYSKDDKNKIVKVKVIHRGCDYLLCILKHEEIYQVSLNLVFEKGEKVIFFIEGQGKVYLSGFEVIDSANATPWDESVSVDITKGMKTSSPKKSTPAQSPKTVSTAESPSSERKARRKVASDERNSPGPYVCNGGMDEDDSDEDDEDFSVEGEESEEEDEESEVDESELEDEVKLLEKEGTESIECNNGEEEEEDIAVSDSTVSHKRKRQMLEQQSGKRSRKESITIDDDVIVCDDSEPPYDTEPQKSSAGTTPNSKSIPATESAEKKKKKKKKKKADTTDSLTKLPKSPSDTKVSPKMSKGGVQIHDIAVGKGPEAIKGKMVHIFYIGRTANKQIFDSRTHGKKPLSFRLGKKSVVRGLEIGMEGMKVGGKRKIIVPPSLGFGSATMDKIPPNSTLEFTVELLHVS